MDENKAAAVGYLPGKFLPQNFPGKYEATVLVESICQICNLSVKYSIFLSDSKISKLKPFFKNSPK